MCGYKTNNFLQVLNEIYCNLAQFIGLFYNLLFYCKRINMKDLLVLFLILAIAFYISTKVKESFINKNCSRDSINTGVYDYRTSKYAKSKIR